MAAKGAGGRAPLRRPDLVSSFRLPARRAERGEGRYTYLELGSARSLAMGASLGATSSSPAEACPKHWQMTVAPGGRWCV